MRRLLAIVAALLTGTSLHADEDFLVYHSDREGVLSQITAHTPGGQQLDLSSMDSLVEFKTLLRDPTRNGLPGPTDQAFLESFSDTILHTASAFGAIYLGELRGGNAAKVYIATPAPNERLRNALPAKLEALGQEFEIRGIRGEQENFYQNYLLPSPFDLEVQDNLVIVGALVAHGDKVKATRGIQHFSFFKNREDAEAFVEEISPYGYEQFSIAETEGPAGDYMVHFFHYGSIDVWELSERTLGLKMAASLFAGEYDGWEALVVTHAEDDF